jgi:hypothetical protein
MSDSPFSSGNAPTPLELPQNQVAGERVLQPPKESEMLSEPPKPAAEPKAPEPPAAETGEQPIPDPLDMPEPRPMTIVPGAEASDPPTPAPAAPQPKPEKDYRPVWAQNQPVQDPAANLSPGYKIGLPDGIYFLAGLMLLPMLLQLQAMYALLDYSDIANIFSNLFGSAFKDFTSVITSLAVLTMGVGAILLVFTRLHLFVLYLYMFQPNWPSSGV